MNEQYKQSYYCRLGQLSDFDVFAPDKHSRGFVCLEAGMNHESDPKRIISWSFSQEYATELRKPCIPCLMQPRFRPYGWVRLWKWMNGMMVLRVFSIPAGHHQRGEDSCWFCHPNVSLLSLFNTCQNAWYSFEEAFALLIREIETIRKVAITKNTGITPSAPVEAEQSQAIFDTNTTNHSRWSSRLLSVHFFYVFEPVNSVLTTNPTPIDRRILNWDRAAVQDWLQRCELL